MSTSLMLSFFSVHSFLFFHIQLYSQLRVYEQHAFFCKSILLKCRRTNNARVNKRVTEKIMFSFYFIISLFLPCFYEIVAEEKEKLFSNKRQVGGLREKQNSLNFYLCREKPEKRFNLIFVQ